MKYNIGVKFKDYNFYIEGASYAGAPRNNTMMYISKKVEGLLNNLYDKSECLVFIEKSIDVPEELKVNNCFVFTDNPQYEYAKFANEYNFEQMKQDKLRRYSLSEQGYYLGENVKIGKNVYIEPQVLIGHDVEIGDNAVILTGAVIKNSIIGDGFLCNEKAIVGANGFTMAEGSGKIRIPSLGRVIVGNNVEIGTNDNISRGSAGDTVIEDGAKIDALVHIGHDVIVRKNAEIVAGSIVGGFADIGENAFLGINSSIRNRRIIGSNTIIGMGAVVTKQVQNDVTVIGNPAKKLQK